MLPASSGGPCCPLTPSTPPLLWLSQPVSSVHKGILPRGEGRQPEDYQPAPENKRSGHPAPAGAAPPPRPAPQRGRGAAPRPEHGAEHGPKPPRRSAPKPRPRGRAPRRPPAAPPRPPPRTHPSIAEQDEARSRAADEHGRAARKWRRGLHGNQPTAPGGGFRSSPSPPSRMRRAPRLRGQRNRRRCPQLLPAPGRPGRRPACLPRLGEAGHGSRGSSGLRWSLPRRPSRPGGQHLVCGGTCRCCTRPQPVPSRYGKRPPVPSSPPLRERPAVPFAPDC